MVFTMLMNLVASTDASILNEGYLAVSEDKKSQLYQWVESVLTYKSFTCAAFKMETSLFSGNKDQC